MHCDIRAYEIRMNLCLTSRTPSARWHSWNHGIMIRLVPGVALLVDMEVLAVCLSIWQLDKVFCPITRDRNGILWTQILHIYPRWPVVPNWKNVGCNVEIRERNHESERLQELIQKKRRVTVKNDISHHSDLWCLKDWIKYPSKLQLCTD